MKDRRIRNLLWIGLGLAVAAIPTIGFVGCTGQYTGTADTITGVTDDFLNSGRTLSYFDAIQVDPPSEDSAGPQYVVADDLDGDGLVDLVSAWNQSQPVQLHLQRRSAAGEIGFVTVILGGNIPVVSVAGLAIADFDADGALDIAVLVKETLQGGGGCLDSEQPDNASSSGLVLLYLGPTNVAQVEQSLAWKETPVEDSRLAGTIASTENPDSGGLTNMAIGDIDLDGDMDILTAWNTPCGNEDGDSHLIVVFANQGPGAVRDKTWVGAPIPNSAPIGSLINDIELGDIDGDGDLDVVATFPDAGSMNVRWFRNPVVDVVDDFHVSTGLWQVGTVGQIATQADSARITDIDGDGLLDVVVRSANGKLIQWLKGPGNQATTEPLPNLPWQVYTMSELRERTPQTLAVGDLNFDGQPEVIFSAGGGLALLDGDSAPSIYDQWIERLIIDDDPPGQPGNSPATTDPNVSPSAVAGQTIIQSILVVDLDGDGANDLIATLDRSGLSGISNDAIVWFRNTLTP